MTKTLAVWYMESAWLKMGILRDIKFFHKLFNLAYGVCIREFLSKQEPEYIAAQKEWGSELRWMLQLNGGQS